MIENLADYFESEHEYYLQQINYKRLDSEPDTNYSLDGIDIINTDVSNNTVFITATRKFTFEPEGIFEIEVSFGAILTLAKEKQNDLDWENINLAEEFKENGDFVLSNLMSRISLLIAQITSSFGRQPLITPPNVFVQRTPNQ